MDLLYSFLCHKISFTVDYINHPTASELGTYKLSVKGRTKIDRKPDAYRHSRQTILCSATIPQRYSIQ